MKIEEKLKKYEKTAPVSDDRDLSAALRSILAEEEERDFAERDYDLIAELTDAILALEGVGADSFEATAADAAAFRRRAEKSAKNAASAAEATARPRASRRLRRLIPIAAILAALLVGAAIASSLGLNVFEMAADVYNGFVVGERYSSGDEQLEITPVGETSATFDDLIASGEYPTLLVPASLPEGWRIVSVVADRLADCDLVDAALATGGGETALIRAQLGLERQITAATEPIGAYDVFVSEYDGICQGEFSVGADYYLIQAPDRESMTAIIEGMEAVTK